MPETPPAEADNGAAPPALPATRERSRAFRVFALVLTALALVWVGWMLAQSWPALQERMRDCDPRPLAVGLLLSLLAAAMLLHGFILCARPTPIAALGRRELAHLFFMAQLLKHLPGRVWGIAYQWRMSTQANAAGSWITLNAVFMALATYFAVATAFVVIAATRGPLPFIVALVAALGLYQLAWWLAGAPATHALLARFGGRIGMLGAALDDYQRRLNAGARLRLFGSFALVSLLTYLSWAAYGAAYPGLGAAAAMQLCACYMLAWFVGYITLITPSGVGVRELVFAWLAQDYSADTIAWMALIGRISLLLVDVILGLAFHPVTLRRGKPAQRNL